MKKFFAIALALVMLLSLAACGSTNSDSTNTDTPSANDQPQPAPDDKTDTPPAGHTVTLDDGTVFPSKDISLIIPWKAGGNTDIYSRQLTALMEDYLGVNIVVINTNGGGGQVGYQTLIGASADGYTLCATSNSMLLAPYTGVGDSAVKYDSVKHLAMWGNSACALAVPAKAGYDTLEDFIDAAKAAPGTLRISNSGVGSTWHACAMTFASNAGIEVSYIPYDSGTEAVTAAAGGHVEAVLCGVSECSSLVESGDLKVLAVSSPNVLYPDAKTFEDCGVPNMWGGFNDFIVPAGTPDAVADLLVEAMEYAVNTDTWKDFMEAGGQSWVWMTGDELMSYYADLDVSLSQLFA